MFKTIKSFFPFQTNHSDNKRTFDHETQNRLSEDQSIPEDHYLKDYFACTPKTLPPKFDSIADQLMADQAVSDIESSNDTQQLFLYPRKNSLPENSQNHEILEQLRQLIQLLVSITSEQNKSIVYNTVFLREILHNICQDLNVMLSDLDFRLMLEPNSVKENSDK